MYVGLSVRDECERSMKNQASKIELVNFVIGSQVACEKQPAKRQCVEHMIGRSRVMPGYHFCDCLARNAKPRKTHKSLCLAKSCVCLSRKKCQTAKDPQKSLFGKKLCLLYYVFTHTIYTLITHKSRVLFIEKTLDNTFES